MISSVCFRSRAGYTFKQARVHTEAEPVGVILSEEISVALKTVPSAFIYTNHHTTTALMLYS